MKTYFNNLVRKVFVKSDKYNKFILLLDAGHGGLINNIYVTAGKRSPKWSDGEVYYEGVGNRQIVDKLIIKIINEGINYELLHNGNEDTKLRLRSNKAKDIVEENPDKHVFGISVHSNGVDDQRAYGWQVHIFGNKAGKSSKKSTEFAEIAVQEFKKVFPARKVREGGKGIKRNNLHMTRETPCPFILLENFFHTNKKECQEILQTEEGQNKIVDFIFNTILAYMNKHL